MDISYRVLFQRFGKYFKPYRARLLWGSLLRALSAVLFLYGAYALAGVVDFITKYQSGDSIAPVFVIFITWYIVIQIRFILIYYSKILCVIAGEKISLDVQSEAIKHLALLDISWHEKEGAGGKVKRTQRGGIGISTLVRVWIVNIIDIIVGFIGMIYIVAHFSYGIAALLIVYQVIYFAISTSFRKKTVASNKKKLIEEERVTGVMFEIVNNIRSVKVLGMAKSLLDFLAKINVDFLARNKETLVHFHNQILARTSWEVFARTTLYAFVVYEVIQGHYQVSFFILFTGYFSNLTASVNDLASVAQEASLAKADIIRLSEILEKPITIEDESGKTDFPAEWDAIHINNLSFAYGENQVLSNISLDITKGEKVGIVGLSGAGKSTLFKILLKEYEAAQNDILIGSVPLNNIKVSNYTQHVAVVLQDTEVFNMSVRQNIQLANSARSNDEDLFTKAIKVAHVEDFFHRLPNGADTVIGEKGVKLSGGEKQRLGIARAVYKNPQIFFLDEATSHLDVESEQKIQDSLAHFFKDVTAVVIAHRLSTIKEMDRIIVMENGKIIETGSFDELYTQDGRFREFWDKQKI